MTNQQVIQACIDACLQCLQDCERLIAACLGSAAHAEAVRISRDCADICQLCLYLMLRRSELHTRSCDICVEVCRRCALVCEGFDDMLCRRAAASCRHCAELCSQLALDISAA